MASKGVATIAAIAAAALLIGGGIAYTVSQNQAANKAAAAKQVADAEIAAAKKAAAENERALAMPDLPVKVSTRKAMLGSGLVAQIRNFSGAELALAVTASSSATSQFKKFQIVVPAGGAIEIGHSEGWPFTTGDELLITENGYRPMKVRIGG